MSSMRRVFSDMLMLSIGWRPRVDEQHEATGGGGDSFRVLVKP